MGRKESGFRYDSEIPSAGAIKGVQSTKDKKSFPKIKIGNYVGPAEITVSLVCKDEPYRVHPNGIVGKKKTSKEPFTYIYVKEVEVTKNDCVFEFEDLGIRIVKPIQVEEALRFRKQQNVDPFGQGFSHKFDTKTDDLQAVRLCFHVKLAHEYKLDPVVSDVIYHSKTCTLGCLQIREVIPMSRSCHASNTSEPKVIIMSHPQQLNLKDLEVVFYEKQNGEVMREHCVRKFDTSSIVCTVPPSICATVECGTEVNVVLRKLSDGTCGDPKPFTYYADTDAIIKRKRKKHNNIIQDFVKKNWTPPASLPPDYVSENDQDWRNMPGPFDVNPTMPGPSPVNPAMPEPSIVNPAVPVLSSVNAGVSGLNYVNSAVPRQSYVQPAVLGPSSVNAAVSGLNHINSAVPRPSHVNPAVPVPSSINAAVSGLHHVNSAKLRPSHVNSDVPGPNFINPAVSWSNHDNSVMPRPSSVNTTMPGSNSLNASILGLNYVKSAVPEPGFVNSAVPEPGFVNSAVPGQNYVNPFLQKPTEWEPMQINPYLSPDVVPMPSISQPMSVTEDEGFFSPNGHLDKDGEYPGEDSALADVCYDLIDI